MVLTAFLALPTKASTLPLDLVVRTKPRSAQRARKPLLTNSRPQSLKKSLLRSHEDFCCRLGAQRHEEGNLHHGHFLHLLLSDECLPLGLLLVSSDLFGGRKFFSFVVRHLTILPKRFLQFLLHLARHHHLEVPKVVEASPAHREPPRYQSAHT